MLSLLRTFLLLEVLMHRPAKWKALLVLGNLPREAGILGAVLPVLCELIWCTWDLVLHSLSGFTLLRVRNGGQEVTGCLARWIIPPHLYEELPSLVAGTVIDLMAFV